MTARDTAISAGWAFSVSVRVSSGPLNMICGQLLAQRRVDLVEDVACAGVGFGEFGAHADRLAPLPRKYESDSHSCPTKLPV